MKLCRFVTSDLPPWMIRCIDCNTERGPFDEPPARYRRQCGSRNNGGPGTEFMKITQQLGLKPPRGCSCHDLQIKMDAMGVDGCRERFVELKDEIILNIEKWGWSDFFANIATAFGKSFTTGLAWKINPLDPLGSLLSEAIRRTDSQ